MLNYISALKSFATRCDLQEAVFEQYKIHMYIKAVQKTAPAKIKHNNIVDIAFLKETVSKCPCTYLGQMFKSRYFLGFFGFLRLSNMAPHLAAFFHT